MRTITSGEFARHPDMYFDMAREDEICVQKGDEMFHIVYQQDFPPLLEPDEELARAITMEELLKGIHEDIDRKWDERRKLAERQK